MSNQLLDDNSFETEDELNAQKPLSKKEKDIQYLKSYTLFFILSCCLSIVYIRVNCMPILSDIAPNPEKNSADFLKIMLAGLLYLQVFLLAELAIIFLFIESLRTFFLQQMQRVSQVVTNKSSKLFFAVQQVIKIVTYLIMLLFVLVIPIWLFFLFLVKSLVTTVFALIWYLIPLIFGITLDTSTYYTDITFFTVLTMVVGSFLMLYLFLKKQIEAD